MTLKSSKKKVITRAQKVKIIQAHFNIPENQWLQFQDRLPDLGYSTASEFFRDKVRTAVREASKKREDLVKVGRIVPPLVGRKSKRAIPK